MSNYPVQEERLYTGQSDSDKSMILKLKDKFFKESDAKTGWGKNEIKDLFRDCMIKVMQEKINEDQD